MSRPRIPTVLDNKLKTLGEQIACCEFLPPKGFYQAPIKFQPIGIPGYARWNPKIVNGKRVLAVAPFVNGSTLDAIRALGTNHSRLISLPQELDTVSTEHLDKWSAINVLDNELNVSDEEVLEYDSKENNSSTLSGLHAKFVVVEHQRSQATWMLGSANLTAAASNGHNVELIAQLSGRTNQVGINRVWKEIERFCQDYKRSKYASEVSDDERNAQDLLNQPKRSFLDSQRLCVVCRPEISGGLTVDAQVQVYAWPISVNQDQCKELLLPVSWKSIPEERLISFTAFRFSVEGFSDLFESFVLNLPTSGVSQERVDKVLSSVIDSTEKLLLFLRLLLGENYDDWVLPTENGSKTHGVFDQLDFAMETLLEDLLRVAARQPKRLEPFQKLISNLQETPEGRALIPKDLEMLWKAVEQALAK